MAVAPFSKVGKRFPSTVIALLAIALSACASPSTHELAQNAQQILHGKPIANVSVPVWKDVRKFYESSSGAPVWVNHRGATKQGIKAFDVLRSAPSHGLKPSDYR